MPAGYTAIQYNDIFLRDVLTKDFRQEPVFTQDGQTMMYHRFTVTVQGWYVTGHKNSPSGTVEIESIPRSSHTTPGSRYAHLTRQLTERGQKFEMRVGVGGPGEQVILKCEALPTTAGVFSNQNQLFAFYDRAGGPVVRRWPRR